MRRKCWNVRMFYLFATVTVVLAVGCSNRSEDGDVAVKAPLGIEVNVNAEGFALKAPGVDVKVNDDGVGVQAPLVDVKVNAEGTTVAAPGVDVKANAQGVTVDAPLGVHVKTGQPAQAPTPQAPTK
jgi:hypothetical protein